MRLWTLHPKYLDAQGLVSLWREALLAQAVLKGETVGYRHHPQLLRFKAHADPLAAIARYLRAVHEEALARSYRFDATKIGLRRSAAKLVETRGQLEYEWAHLQTKLRARNPVWLRRWKGLAAPEPHPLFRLAPGPRREWERIRSKAVAKVKPKHPRALMTPRKPKL